jgi:hypothetical protein
MDQLLEGAVEVQRFVRLQAEVRLALVGSLRFQRGEVQMPGAEPAGLQREFQSIGLVAQRLFQPFVFADVDDDGDRTFIASIRAA